MTIPDSAATSDRFDQLALPPSCLSNLEQLGYTRMTPIQAAALPRALAGQDLIAQASTGSGKTVAFGLPLVERLQSTGLPSTPVQAVVLCPTRELADQVTLEIRRLARARANVKVVTLCGGVPLRGQTLSLQHGADVVVGTPGRILDHLERQSLSLHGVHTLVLDEADRMLDLGFFDDIAKVVHQCAKDRQTLLFSATYPPDIAKLAEQFMRAPQQVKVEAQHSTARTKSGKFSMKSKRMNGFMWSACYLRTFVPSARWPFATPNSNAGTWRRCCRRKGSVHWRCMASWSNASEIRCWCSLPIAVVRCWWQPTWRLAAWTYPDSKP